MRSRILRLYQLHIKDLLSYSLKMALWKAETYRCYDLLIIFYIIKAVLDYKIIHILLMMYRLLTGYLKPYVQFYSNSSIYVYSNSSTDNLYRQTQRSNAIQQCAASSDSSEP